MFCNSVRGGTTHDTTYSVCAHGIAPASTYSHIVDVVLNSLPCAQNVQAVAKSLPSETERFGAPHSHTKLVQRRQCMCGMVWCAHVIVTKAAFFSSPSAPHPLPARRLLRSCADQSATPDRSCTSLASLSAFDSMATSVAKSVPHPRFSLRRPHAPPATASRSTRWPR